MSAIGERIKTIRKEAGLTQAQFGEKIGVKGNTMTNYENGMRCPSDAIILSICREFNVNEDWLRDGLGEPHAEISDDEYIAAFLGEALAGRNENIQKRCISVLSKLSAAGWEALDAFANEALKLLKEEEKQNDD